MNTNSTKALQAQKEELSQTTIKNLFQQDSARFDKFSLTAAGLFLDYSKNLIDETTLDLLLDLADKAHLQQSIQDLFSGAKVNFTENRPALHTALRNRSNAPILVDDIDIMPAIEQSLMKMEKLVTAIHSGTWVGYSGQTITDIVNVGIGGSELGPQMAITALQPYSNSDLCFHFIANVDATELQQLLEKIQPARTLFIISSKSFSTQDTLVNAITIHQWFKQKTQLSQLHPQHFIAVTSKPEKALAFGIAANNIFPLWDWVGGRYSLWSAIGLPLALAIGMKNFIAMLNGAFAMDEHFRTASLKQNMPVIMALITIWYRNFWSMTAQAILPYTELLKYFPGYLQQLEMESNGKQTNRDGKKIDYQSGYIIFGQQGTNGQHSFYQLLHQGTLNIPADFIIPLQGHHTYKIHQEILVANGFSQTKVLMDGKSLAEVKQEMLAQGASEQEINALAPHKCLPGNHPSNTIILEKLTPESLGALIALYEHKIFVESVIWEIDAFDQWGVELGKELADKIIPDLVQAESPLNYDSSTNGLIRIFRKAIKVI